ncbi:Ras-related protein rsr1 [Cytospora paraplurivora]|uniref:Ras-related protein rsr1 n=1 Tax=Cytospora paraplurivora TaxID=2898453 RepID=A0AAN9U483_9PEZI
MSMLRGAKLSWKSSMRDVYMRNGQGFLLVFSITSRSSLNELYGLREEILRIKDKEQVPIVIIGNKADLEDQREVPRPKAFAVSQEWGAPYYEASARTRTNVDEVFTDICRQMLMVDDALEAMDEETFDSRYNDDRNKRRRRHKRRKDHPKCVIL